MPGMELYVRFMISLAAGMAGLGLVLKVVMDELLLDYDAPAELQSWFKEFMSSKKLGHRRAEDMMLEMEKARTTQMGVRQIDQRREALREIASVESRLQRPTQQGPIVLTPLPPTPVAPAAEPV